MQTRDNSLTTYRRPTGPRRGKLTTRQGRGAANPTWIPQAHRVAGLLAESINGFAGSSVGEIANVPMTAHFIGGCPIGTDPGHGVIDAYHADALPPRRLARRSAGLRPAEARTLTLLRKLRRPSARATRSQAASPAAIAAPPP